MKLVINGDDQVVEGPITLSGLVEHLGMKSDRVAVELNLNIVPRGQWIDTQLADGDRLEIVHFVGGGSSGACRAGGSIVKRIAALPMVAAILIAIAWAQGPTQFRPGFNLFSKQQDIQLGQENAAQVRKHMKVVHDAFLTEYVTRVGNRLVTAREAQESGFPFTFEVVADPSINAFALPGGPMFINTGLLKAVDNEAQLAGVMGHEMSHVILRHGTNQASKSKLIELPAVLGSQVAGGSLVGQLTQLGIGLGANSVLLKFSRSAESQADLMGSHLMAEAGYNPIEMARFFEKLNAQGGGRNIQFFSDHPNPDNRERAIEQEVQRLPQKDYRFQTGQFEQMKQMVARIREPKPKPLASAQPQGDQQQQQPQQQQPPQQ